MEDSQDITHLLHDSFDPRKSKGIELRYFAGLNVEEMAEALWISVATVGRDLRTAEAWIRRELST